MVLVGNGKAVMTRLESSEVGICLVTVPRGGAEVLGSWRQTEGRQGCYEKGI